MKSRLWPVIALLILGFFIRTHHLLIQNPYIDEGFHIKRASVVWDFAQNPGRFSQGKVLLYFWLGLFETGPLTALFSARFGMALFAVITGSAVYLLGKLLRDHSTAVIALAIYTVLPFTFFYERLAMADSFAAGLMALVAWRSIIFARRPRWQEGIILGVLIAFTTMAKLTMGFIPLLPLAAAVIYSKTDWIDLWIRAYMPPLLLAGIVFILIWSPLAVPAYLERDNPEAFALVSDYNVKSFEEVQDDALEHREESLRRDRQEYIKTALKAYLKRIDKYVKGVWPLIEDFTGEVLPRLIVTIALGGLTLTPYDRRHLWNLLFILFWLGLITALILVKATLITSRYFMPAVIPIVLLIATTITGFWQLNQIGKVISAGIGIFLIGWVIIFALPFADAALNNPDDLPLEGTNHTEYQTAFLSGDDALRDAADVVNTLDQEPVYATWNICDMLYFYTEKHLRCLGRTTSTQELVDFLGEDFQPGESGYLVISGWGNPPFFTKSSRLRWEEIAKFERKQIKRPVWVYRLWLPPSNTAMD